MYRPVGEMTLKKAEAFVRSRLKLPQFLDLAMEQYPSLRTRKAAKQHIKRNLNQSAAALVERFDSVIRKNMEEREELMDRQLRVVCFSADDARPLDEILMWSHYADCHRGVRIGFEFPDGITSPFKIIQVTYQDTRVAIDLSLGSEMPRVSEALEQSIKTKSSSWAYEREHRLVTIPRFCVQEHVAGNVLEFIQIKPEWVRRIDFGARSPQSKIDYSKRLIEAGYGHVRYFEAKYHDTEYALVYVEL
jgi:hypothetical protein